LDRRWESATGDKYGEAIGFGPHEKLFFPEFAIHNNNIIIDFLK
jgi:hypothetical protein